MNRDVGTEVQMWRSRAEQRIVLDLLAHAICKPPQLENSLRIRATQQIRPALVVQFQTLIGRRSRPKRRVLLAGGFGFINPYHQPIDSADMDKSRPGSRKEPAAP